ncbi:hypothetical protein ACP70R_025127 [Stipagrostis hirtigluma subsp. patula]
MVVELLLPEYRRPPAKNLAAAAFERQRPSYVEVLKRGSEMAQGGGAEGNGAQGNFGGGFGGGGQAHGGFGAAGVGYNQAGFLAQGRGQSQGPWSFGAGQGAGQAFSNVPVVGQTGQGQQWNGASGGSGGGFGSAGPFPPQYGNQQQNVQGQGVQQQGMTFGFQSNQQQAHGFGHGGPSFNPGYGGGAFGRGGARNHGRGRDRTSGRQPFGRGIGKGFDGQQGNNGPQRVPPQPQTGRVEQHAGSDLGGQQRALGNVLEVVPPHVPPQVHNLQDKQPQGFVSNKQQK